MFRPVRLIATAAVVAVAAACTGCATTVAGTARPAPAPSSRTAAPALAGACTLVTGPELGAAFAVGGIRATEGRQQTAGGATIYTCSYAGHGLHVVLQAVVLAQRTSAAQAKQLITRSVSGSAGQHVTPVPGLGVAASTYQFTKGATTFDGIAAVANGPTASLGIVGVCNHRPNGTAGLAAMTRTAFGRTP